MESCRFSLKVVAFGRGEIEMLCFMRVMSTNWQQEASALLKVYIQKRQRLSVWNGDRSRGSRICTMVGGWFREMIDLISECGLIRPFFRPLGDYGGNGRGRRK